MIRKIISIIGGYATFVVTSLALFKLSGQKPHADPTLLFMIFSVIYGAIFSFTAGVVTQLISGTKDVKLNYILAFIIAGFAAFSMFKSDGNHWTQILAMLVFAPASVLGGLYFTKKYKQ
ncbi:hypothetical protein [Dyadobacter frigoris]|uniref:TIGR04086 family membrane protein n=1 Tax=Dyadobacter frigoris TaxID=2576211 RepID=A0A4U6D043_9BACT|nr:hypothetical protein [Dyadobacter frigoris]TKT90422.1 hypothetical protein FDK13_18950 [Dyadobacter frigoris]GLU51456.1 hypothetical protein Dfri01_09170 [Dyadobacter frigoris]